MSLKCGLRLLRYSSTDSEVNNNIMIIKSLSLLLLYSI